MLLRVESGLTRLVATAGDDSLPSNKARARILDRPSSEMKTIETFLPFSCQARTAYHPIAFFFFGTCKKTISRSARCITR